MSITNKLAMNIQTTANQAGFASSLLTIVPFDRPVVVIDIESRASRQFEDFLESTYPTIKWEKGLGKKNISVYHLYPGSFTGNKDVVRVGNPFLEDFKKKVDAFMRDIL